MHSHPLACNKSVKDQQKMILPNSYIVYKLIAQRSSFLFLLNPLNVGSSSRFVPEYFSIEWSVLTSVKSAMHMNVPMQ